MVEPVGSGSSGSSSARSRRRSLDRVLFVPRWTHGTTRAPTSRTASARPNARRRTRGRSASRRATRPGVLHGDDASEGSGQAFEHSDDLGGRAAPPDRDDPVVPSGARELRGGEGVGLAATARLPKGREGLGDVQGGATPGDRDPFAGAGARQGTGRAGRAPPARGLGSQLVSDCAHSRAIRYDRVFAQRSQPESRIRRYDRAPCGVPSGSRRSWRPLGRRRGRRGRADQQTRGLGRHDPPGPPARRTARMLTRTHGGAVALGVAYELPLRYKAGDTRRRSADRRARPSRG